MIANERFEAARTLGLVIGAAIVVVLALMSAGFIYAAQVALGVEPKRDRLNPHRILEHNHINHAEHSAGAA